MSRVVISGVGVFHPETAVSNEALMASFNEYVDHYNAEHAAEIEAGERQPLKHSSDEFVQKASGIKSRYLMDAKNVLDTKIMQPLFARREDDTLSLQAEMCVKAAERALKDANKSAENIDMVVVACSNLQRAFPAVSIEVQNALGIEGYAYDMNVACSSATFAIFNAYQALKTGAAKAALLINPEICSAHLNFKDRDSHFIFGDACAATVVELEATCHSNAPVYEIIDTALKTVYSNNIRNNFGFLLRCEQDTYDNPARLFDDDLVFRQQGRRVFRDVVPMVSDMIIKHLEKNKIAPKALSRIWLHQANSHINDLVSEKVLGHKPTKAEAPLILDEFANTSSPGCLIAFERYRADLPKGAIGMLCSFGAGYSAGTVIIKKMT